MAEAGNATVVINSEFVDANLGNLAANEDLSRYIL